MSNSALANNTSYITLSNQIARKRQLEVVANNAANTNTNGYEQDDILLRKVDYKQNSKRDNSFVWAETTYQSGEEGGVRVTDKPTDVAIVGVGYFKVITPRGSRYTLDGSMIINRDNILVNIEGHPFANVNGDPIQIPQDYTRIDIAKDGTVFVDDQNTDVIGVFTFNEHDSMIKEGNRLYKTKATEIPSENYTIISGAVKISNVNPTLVMAKMVEMQRSVGMTNNLMSDVGELEKTVIDKIGK